MSDVGLVHFSLDVSSGKRWMPLGCLHLQAALRRAGFTVELRDVQAQREIADDVDALARFMDCDVPLLGVSVMADRLPLALLALERVRRVRPEQVIILGGPGPTEVAGALLNRFPWIDAVAEGEGEETVVEAARALRDRAPSGLRGIAGLWVRADGRAQRPQRRPRVADLDALAYPQWADVDLSAFDSLSIVTSRGCPFDCTFCSAAAIWGERTCVRSLGGMLQEIRWLTTEAPDLDVCIHDDTFGWNGRRIREFCAALEGGDLRFEWHCNMRADIIEPTLLARMAAVGCRSIFLGVESGSDRVLREVGKRTTVAQTTAAVREAARHVDVTAHAIWGYPFEDLREFYATHLLMTYLKSLCRTTALSHFVPFVGAPLVRGWSGDLIPAARFPFPRIVNLGTDPRVAALVCSEPSVFLPFFGLQTSDWQRKVDFARRYHDIVEPL